MAPMPADGRPKLRYEQVMEMIERLIADGGLQAGDVLPTNKDLARLANVSLISVRRALDELEHAGRVRRHQGVGTFVAAERIFATPARAGGLLATLTGDAPPPVLDTRVLEVSQGTPSDDVARSLSLPAGEPVWRIARLRVIGARPMISEQSLIPVRLAPSLDADALAAGASLYELLAGRHGLSDTYEEQYLDVTVPTVGDRRLLGLSARDRVARIRGVSFSHDGTPFDCFQQVYPADGFAFYLSGQTDRHVVPVSRQGAWNVVPAPRQGGAPRVTSGRGPTSRAAAVGSGTTQPSTRQARTTQARTTQPRTTQPRTTKPGGPRSRAGAQG